MILLIYCIIPPSIDGVFMSEVQTKLLIIGAGPAGYTAAVYAARASLSPLLITGLQPGGQLTITTDVENYPGFADAIQGPWLMEQMEQQAKNVGAKIQLDTIVKVDFSSRPFKAYGDSGTTYVAESVIIATGATAKWLGIPSETEFMGAGVSACATCDGFFFRGQKVAVIGGGNSAVEEALYLSNIASEVTLVHRRDTLRSEKILQERLLSKKNVKIIWNHMLDEVLGSKDPKQVTGIRLKSTTDGSTQDLDMDGVFIAIGHTPQTALFKGQINIDEAGYIIAKPGGTATNIPGVFAAGDVQDKVYRQAVTAAGQGCMAALDAEHFLSFL